MRSHPVARAALLLALCLAQAAAFSVPHLGGIRLANRATPLLRTAPPKSARVSAGRTTVPKSRVVMGIFDQVRQALQYGVSLPRRTGREASAYSVSGWQIFVIQHPSFVIQHPSECGFALIVTFQTASSQLVPWAYTRKIISHY